MSATIFTASGQCLCTDTEVYETREKDGHIHRRRRCLACGTKSQTVEIPLQTYGSLLNSTVLVENIAEKFGAIGDAIDDLLGETPSPDRAIAAGI